MNSFSFSDLKNVVWIPTIKLALARGFSTGLVFMIILALQPSANEVLAQVLATPFLFAIVSLPMALFCMGLGWLFGLFIPMLGVMTHWIGALIVFLGDPLVYFFNRQYPAVLDIADFKFYNFEPLIFITHPE